MVRLWLVLLLTLGGGLVLAQAPTPRAARIARAFRIATGYPQGRPGYVVDHVFPLCAGGSDTVSNLQWQPRARATAKDRDERRLCAAVRAFRAKWTPEPPDTSRPQ